jgi:3-hydroxyacyl-CoA dehydrogenase
MVWGGDLENQGTLVTSNTSGIPIHFMSEGREAKISKSISAGLLFFNVLKLF